MSQNRSFQVLLLPQHEVVVRRCSLTEAVAFMRGYHEVMNSQHREAVIREMKPRRRLVEVGSLATLRQ